MSAPQAASEGTDRAEAAVLIVEDHDQMRAMLVESVRRLDGFVVHGTATSVGDALALVNPPAPGSPPDVVMLDLALADGTGIELIRSARTAVPSLPCLVLSGHRDSHGVNDALAAGAAGYLVKGYPEELGPALRAVAGGGRYLSSALRGDPDIDPESDPS